MQYGSEGRLGRSAAAVAGAVAVWTAMAAGAQAQQAPSVRLESAPPVNGFGEMLKPTTVARRSTAAQASAALPYAPIQKTDDEGQIPEIEMFVGESRVFPAPGVARIAVGNGTLLTAAALDSKEVILFANGAGTSSLFLWNADGRYQRVKISIVPGDTSRQAREIAAFLSTIPKARASVVGANVIVEGDGLSDADRRKIKLLIDRYPQIVDFTNQVGWEQMVQMDVKVVEFPISTLREIGLKWSSTGGVAVGGIWQPIRRGSDGPFQINQQSGTTNAPPITGVDGNPLVLPSGLNVLSVLNLGLDAQLSLLEQEGKAATLAEPQLSARNGATASFIAGGEIPYSVTTLQGVHVEFKSYGIKLEITPQVDANGVIRAKIASEVSSIDPSVSTIAGPALLTRSSKTEFNLRSGETMVLAGLLQRTASTDVDKVPLLGDIPILGALFRSKRYQNKETELVVFVTPRVVTADSPGMRDRIQRTTERLEQRMGPSPYLSDPLQPGVHYEDPDAVPAASAGVPSRTVPNAAAPVVSAPTLLPEPVVAGRPAPIPRAAASSSGGSVLRVVVSRTLLRATPDATGTPLLQLAAGATVLLGRAELQAAGGGWRNVTVGALDGWVRADAVMPVGQASVAADPSAGVVQRDRRGPPALAEVGPGSLAGLTAERNAATTAPRWRVQLDRLALRVTPDMNAGVIAHLPLATAVEALPMLPRGGWIAVQATTDGVARRGWVAAQWLEPLAESGAAVSE